MKTKKMILTGAAAFVAAGVLGLAPINAADEPTTDGSGTTDVTYSNMNGADGDSGVWMVTFPSAIQFQDGDESKDLPLELLGAKGYTLDELGDDLEVQVSASSKNGYAMYLNGTDSQNKELYTVTYKGTSVTTNSDKNSGLTEVAKLTKTAPKDKGVATLTGTKPTVKGDYSDVITYSLTHTGSDLK